MFARRNVGLDQPVDGQITAPDRIVLADVAGDIGELERDSEIGGAVERVSFAGNYNISPALSPDGRLLAFITRQGNAFRLMTMDLDGGTATPLTETADDESPSFAPNGRLLVYATRTQGQDVLMTTTLDGRIKTRLLSSGADMREPAWGPYGR